MRAAGAVVLGVVLCSSVVSADEEQLLIARPRARFTAALAGHGMVTSIVDRAHWGGGGSVMLGGAIPRGPDAAVLFGGTFALYLAETPMGRSVSAGTIDFSIGLRSGGSRFMVGALVGMLGIARSTGDAAQSTLVLGLALAVAQDVVRWQTGGVFVEARLLGVYGLPLASLGAGVRFE